MCACSHISNICSRAFNLFLVFHSFKKKDKTFQTFKTTRAQLAIYLESVEPILSRLVIQIFAEFARELGVLLGHIEFVRDVELIIHRHRRRLIRSFLGHFGARRLDARLLSCLFLFGECLESLRPCFATVDGRYAFWVLVSSKQQIETKMFEREIRILSL